MSEIVEIRKWPIPLTTRSPACTTRYGTIGIFPLALPALERLLFSQIPKASNLLDLCCGSGHVTREFVRRGYRVSGIDASAELIAKAQRELPQANFRVLDARRLDFDSKFQAVVSTFDALNHILTLEELRTVFAGVHRSLVNRGIFVFDMNLEEAYSLDLQQWSVTIKEHDVSLVRGIYDAETKLASTELIWFSKAGNGDLWEQRKSEVEERCYTQTEILQALDAAGFRSLEAIPAQEAGVNSDLGFGRVFFVGEK